MITPIPGTALNTAPADFLTARRWTAALFTLEAVTVTVPVIILGAAIGFPDILDAPAAQALKVYAAAPNLTSIGYTIFCLSSFLLLPTVVMASRTLGGERSGSLGRVAEVLGIAAGITQLLGFIRWLFLVPALSAQFQNPQATQASRDAVAVVYDSFNVWAGKAVGEHLGFVFLGTWMMAVCILAARQRSLPIWATVSGAGIGLAILVSAFAVLLPGLTPLLATLNFAANTVWVFWLVVVSLLLLRRPQMNG